MDANVSLLTKNDKIANIISSTRSPMMGIAIILVILYHARCSHLGFGPLNIVFNYGLVGVDIFMFYSAYGLCRSISSNSTKVFLKRRFSRILPLYVALVAITLIFNVLNGGGGYLNALGCMSTLFFWGVGDTFVDWYLTFLLYLYIAFPLLYYAVKRFGFLAVLAISLCALLGVWNIDHSWWHESAFCRIPIFMSGIYLYTTEDKVRAIILSLVMFAILSIYSTLSGAVWILYYIVPFVLLVLSIAIYRIDKVYIIDHVLSFFGKHTLELYVSNCIILLIFNRYGVNMSTTVQYMVYFIGTAVIGYILFILNSLSAKFLK